MRFGSVCSGIEAASVAWHGLGWEPAWLAEVDVAAANVLSHRLGATAPRFPLPKTETAIAKMRWGNRVTNWGDMTKLPDLVRSGEAEAPDVFCGGCPCQSFSLAGLRRGLDDTRGNLTLTFVEIANEIDLKRAENGDEPCIIFYENVPGLLSDKTNAFGCFLAGLAGEDVPLEPSGNRWSDAGCVVGPQRTVAWRSLDAQYFGLAQRRERVFVVASAREGFDPVEILLEFDGLRRDSAPSREAWEETAGTLDARSTGGGFPGTDGACSGHDVPAERPGRAVGLTTEQTPKFSEDVALTLTKQSPSGGGQPQAVVYPQWWDGSPVSQTLDAVLHKGQTMPEKNRFPAVLQPIPLDTTQITSPSNYSNPKPGAPCHPLAAGAHVPAIAFHPTQDPISSEDGTTHALGCGSSSGQASIAIAFSSKDYGADAAEELAPTMRAMGHKDSHPNAGGQIAIATFANAGHFGTMREAHASDPLRAKGGDTVPGGESLAVCVTGDRTHALNTANNGKGCSEDGTGRGVPTVAVSLRGREGGGTIEVGDEVQGTLRASGGGGDKPHVFTDMAVRRLMPVECERLQGFFDWWTAVPTTPVAKANQAKAREAMAAGDPSFCEIDGTIFNIAADGPRYKQLGNSWAVPVVTWIGARIDRHVRALDSHTVAATLDPATIAWIIAA